VDLVVAADSLPYLGDLASVFKAAHGLLRPGGCFALTADLLGMAADPEDPSPPNATAGNDAPSSPDAANDGGGGGASGGAAPSGASVLGNSVAPEASLQFTGRFAHPQAYLERLAASVGFTIAAQQTFGAHASFARPKGSSATSQGLALVLQKAL
jgi:hypothetical protein